MNRRRTGPHDDVRTAPATEESPTGTVRERGGIQSLERAAAILEAVAARSDGIGLAELSVKVGLHTSTAFHLIKTLVGLGFLIQSADNRRYRIGSRLFALAAGALDDTTLLHLATPLLERLSTETGEAAHLAVRSRQDIIVIARTAATGLLQLSDRAGTVRPAHATAIGKMLLAEMPQNERDRLLASLPLPAFTPDTIVDRAALVAELADVQSQGLAHDRGELDPDVHCIAMAVRDFAGRCVAAVGISGPVWRMTPRAITGHVAILAAAARELSTHLGFSIGTGPPDQRTG